MAQAVQSVSVDVIAKILCLTERRVQQLVDEGVLLKVERGKYPLLPCVQAYIKYLQQESRQGTNGSDAMANSKLRQANAKAEIIEMKAERMKGELIPAVDVKEAWEDMAANMRARFLNLPNKVAPLVIGAKDVNEARETLKTEIHEALRELSKTEITVTPRFEGASDAGKPGEEHI